MTKKNQNRLWFAIVMGMLTFGIGMVIWTVKQAVSLPVQESNDFMLKYQQADMNINSIMENKAKFDAKYTIELQNREFITLDEEHQNTNSKRKQERPVKLNMGDNIFSYAIKDKHGENVKNVQFTFLLTRPFTRTEDKKEDNVTISNGLYVTKTVKLEKKGRYTLQVKATINGLTGYLTTSAYLSD